MRPDIIFAVSQVARFNHAPKQSHVTTVKTIVRYLAGTADKGMIVKSSKTYDIDAYVDADFAGLHGSEEPRNPASAKSRTGWIIFLSDCPLIWRSHLQTEISLSSLGAEYSALSSCMRTLIPLRKLILEVISYLGLQKAPVAMIRCKVFEDNNGALLLATNQRVTSRAKYFSVKWHHFWSHVKSGEIVVQKVETREQIADNLTKMIARVCFEYLRKKVQGW